LKYENEDINQATVLKIRIYNSGRVAIGGSEAVLLWRPAPVVTPEGDQAGADAAVNAEPALVLALDGMSLIAPRDRMEALIQKRNLYPELVHGKDGMAAAVTEFRRRLDVTIVKESAVHLRFDAETWETAQGVLSALVTGAVDAQAARRRAAREQIERSRRGDREEAQAALAAREAELKAFVARQREGAEKAGAPPGEDKSPRAGTRGPDSAQIAVLQHRMSDLETRLVDADKATVAPPARPVGHVDPALVGAYSDAQDDLAVARQQLANQRVRFTDEHPDVKAALARLEQAQAKLRQAEAALASARAAAEAPAVEETVAAAAAVAAQERAAELRHQLAATKSQLATLRARAAVVTEKPATVPDALDEEERLRLTTAVNEARERLRELETAPAVAPAPASASADTSAAALDGELVVVAAPTRPGRAREGERREIALLGGAGSIVVALMVMLVAAFLDRRLYSRRDVERIIGPDVIVVVTKLAGKSV